MDFIYTGTLNASDIIRTVDIRLADLNNTIRRHRSVNEGHPHGTKSTGIIHVFSGKKVNKVYDEFELIEDDLSAASSSGHKRLLRVHAPQL